MSSATLASLEEDVRELIRRRRLDPVRDDVAVRAVIGEAVAEYDERALIGGLPALGDAVEIDRKSTRLNSSHPV